MIRITLNDLTIFKNHLKYLLQIIFKNLHLHLHLVILISIWNVFGMDTHGLIYILNYNYLFKLQLIVQKSVQICSKGFLKVFFLLVKI